MAEFDWEAFESDIQELVEASHDAGIKVMGGESMLDYDARSQRQIVRDIRAMVLALCQRPARA